MDGSLNVTLHLRMWGVFSLCIFLLFFSFSACFAVVSDGHGVVLGRYQALRFRLALASDTAGKHC